jgi:ubiquinone/menaquinone biosynthesis C-methylase UbiE
MLGFVHAGVVDALSAPYPRALTQRAHDWIDPALGPGARALDATAGNGRDTLFLARGVAPGGRVDAFDVQARALQRARRRVAGAGERVQLRWYRSDHARLARHLGDTAIDAAMFNLGWCPGGDRLVITRPESTLAALEGAARRLRPGGRLSVIAYRGHPGGTAEAAAVDQWLAGLAGPFATEPPEPADERPEAPVLYRARVLA